MYRYAIFEAEEDWGKSVAVFSKGNPAEDDGVCEREGSSVSVWDINNADAALPLLSTSPLDSPVADYLGLAGKSLITCIEYLMNGCGSVADRLEDRRRDEAGETSELDIARLLRRTGLVASSYCRYLKVTCYRLT